VVTVQDMDDARAQPLLFSQRYACPVCDYSLTELEPRLFSFNSPVGACPACDGLGVTQFFDPDRIVAHPHLSLAGGAVRGWDRRNPYYFQLINALAKHYGFDVDTPWNRLGERAPHAVLYGSGGVAITVTCIAAAVGRSLVSPAFEGIVHNLERRYRETDSQAVREELSKYIADRPCPECQGDRLNRSARNVFVADRSLPELSRQSIGECNRFFESLQLPGWRGEIATKIVKEIRDRLRFLIDVGLDYLTLERKAETLSGGEAQRIRLAS